MKLWKCDVCGKEIADSAVSMELSQALRSGWPVPVWKLASVGGGYGDLSYAVAHVDVEFTVRPPMDLCAKCTGWVQAWAIRQCASGLSWRDVAIGVDEAMIRTSGRERPVRRKRW